ncbi:hypothetical protein [Chitinimonas sp.]|uniref:hypothetical protein n=1 Tax=Chitinimonas sp. TaxID=1934313 RepID=UPI0035AE828F
MKNNLTKKLVENNLPIIIIESLAILPASLFSLMWCALYGHESIKRAFTIGAEQKDYTMLGIAIAAATGTISLWTSVIVDQEYFFKNKKVASIALSSLIIATALSIFVIKLGLGETLSINPITICFIIATVVCLHQTIRLFVILLNKNKFDW